MGRWQTIVACGLLLAFCVAAEPRERAARISIELYTDEGFGVDSAHRWYQVFTDLGVNQLRIRQAESGDEIGISARGKSDSPTYDVKGRITSGNLLMLPGGKFSLHDSARLKQWLKNLADQGVDGVTGRQAKFGLTEVQMHEVQEDLKRPVAFSTRDLPADEAVEKIASGLRLGLQIAPAARGALAKRKVTENLSGTAGGTALAVILRPAGLVFAPQRVDGKATQYQVGFPQAGHEAWPVGHSGEKPDRELVPDLFKFIHVEIDETPLPEATAKIQERLDLPFFWDHYALESQTSNPLEATVKLPAKKLTYGMILGKILSQAKLQKELRVDDAGKPFLWITTLIPVPLGAK